MLQTSWELDILYRIVNFRTIIEKFDTHEKYYPKVVSFSTEATRQFTQAPSANITIASTSNLGDPESASVIDYNDIIRLQASIKNYAEETAVWTDLFEGRIQNQHKPYDPSSGTNISLDCVGHIQEAFDKTYTVDTTYENTDASLVLEYATEDYLKNIFYKSDYADTGIICDEYNAVILQNTVADTFMEMEKISGYTYQIGVKPTYTEAGLLDKCYLTWQKMSTTPTPLYAVKESPRLLSANFSIIGEDVKNYRYVKGGTYSSSSDSSSSTNYQGSAKSDSSISKYGAKYAVDTFSWIESDALCTQVASGLVSDSQNPYVAGSVTLDGTIDAKPGDLVLVDLPKLALKAESIDGYYTAARVKQNFDGNSYNTSIDLGKIKPDAYDYIHKNLTQILQIAYKNQH